MFLSRMKELKSKKVPLHLVKRRSYPFSETIASVSNEINALMTLL